VNFLGLAIVVLAISAIGMLAAPVSASTTSYSGTGTPRVVIEQANNGTAGAISSNSTQFGFNFPTGGWTGNHTTTSFTGITRNADFVQNGQFTGSPNPPWKPSTSGDTTYLTTGFNSSVTGSTTGADYIRFKGKETVQRTIDANFTDSNAGWTGNILNKTGSSGITYSYANVSTNGGEYQESGSCGNTGYYGTIGHASVVSDQNFSYSGSGVPDFAVLSYKFYISQWSGMSSGSMTVRLILTRFSDGKSFDMFTPYQVSSTTSKPLSVTTVNIASYLTAAGWYRVRLLAFIYLNVPSFSVGATASVNWDDTGVYVKYNHYSSPSQAMWLQTFNFNQYAVANGKVTFKYYTNLTTLNSSSSSNSYVTVWVNGTSSGTQYNVIPFSSVTVGSWATISQTIPLSMLNQSTPLPTVSLGIGVYIGTNLEINSTVNPRFYFTNVTFFIDYKPTPASIKLGIVDDLNHKRWNDTDATYGSGTLVIKPSAPWTGSPTTFHIVFNATNGKAGYNATLTAFNYASTIYASRSSSTSPPTFTVHDDTTTSWYCNFNTSSSLSGYINYNVSVYIPASWIQAGKVTTVDYAGNPVTDYITTYVNSSTWLLKVPASDFSPPKFRLDIYATSPNYLGPSSVRILLYTQVNMTDSPGPGNWANASYFIPQNITRLVGVIRNGTGGVPSRLGSGATVNLFNASKSSTTPYETWNSVTVNGTGYVILSLSPWSTSNVGKSTSWFFEIQWNNGREAGDGIVYFTTNSAPSTIVPTSLSAPKAPYTVPYGDGFTLISIYKNIKNGSGIQGATVKWWWAGNSTLTKMNNVTGIRGNYTWSISGATAVAHYGTSTIQINATLGGYASQIINVSVTVRNILTTGSASSFVVPYQTYAWNTTVQTSLTYIDADHNLGITGATLFVNKTYANTTIVGTSGIRWWYKYSGSGGIYELFFNATRSTPSGTHAWVFNVTASEAYYQAASFNLNGFYIRDRSTTYTASYLSTITPWGTNATFLVTFEDQDAGGAAIFGATATCTWTNNYIVKVQSNGAYKFSLSVTSPTSMIPQNVSFSISFNKTHWSSITGIVAQVQIRKIDTSLSLTPNPITVYWGDNQTALLVYKDVDNNVNISKASWSKVLVYDAVTGTNYTGHLVYSIYPNAPSNSWTIRVNGSLPVGTYTLWIHAQVSTGNGFYADQWLTPTLAIQQIPTGSEIQSKSVLKVVWGDPGKIVVSYTDTDHGRPIPGASIIVNIDTSILVSPAYDNGSGIYTVFLYTNGSQEKSTPYGFTLMLTRTNYAPYVVSGGLQINAISTGLQVPGQEIVVAYSDPLAFNVYVEDLNHTVGISGAAVVCNWTASGSLGKGFDTDWGNGSYLFNLNSTLKGQGLFTIELQAQKAHYLTVTQYYTFIIGIVNTSFNVHGTPAAAPWGDNLIVLLHYNRTGTSTPVASPVNVTTNWGRPYTFLFIGGQWQLTLNTTGLAIGTYSINITFSKQHYQPHWLITSLTIRSISTKVDVTGPGQPVAWGDSANISITCFDEDHSKNITMSITSDWAYGSNVTTISLGDYTLTLGTKVPIEEAYTVVVTASAFHYTNYTTSITVTIDLIQTSVTLPTSPPSVAWGRNASTSFTCYDTDHLQPLSNMHITSNWTQAPWVNVGPAGQYTLLFNTSVVSEGSYLVVINVSYPHYVTQITNVSITVRSILTIIKNVVYPTSNVTKPNSLVIIVTYFDSDNGKGIANANCNVTGLEGVDKSQYRIDDLHDGRYMLTLNTSWIPDNQLPRTFNITFYFEKQHYNSQTEAVPPIKVVIAPSSGVSLQTVFLAGGGSSGAVIICVLAYVMYRRRKIPFVIKKIDQSISLINKGEVTQPVPMKTRAEMANAIFQTRLAILSKEKIEEPGKKGKKGAKKPEATSEIKANQPQAMAREEAHLERAPEEGKKALEGQAGAESGEADVALIAEELEKLETKGGTEPIREKDLIKREMEELEREAKKRKKKDS
jgi:hypothetical protein